MTSNQLRRFLKARVRAADDQATALAARFPGLAAPGECYPSYLYQAYTGFLQAQLQIEKLLSATDDGLIRLTDMFAARDCDCEQRCTKCLHPELCFYGPDFRSAI